ncbi:MAG: hypothetical protein JNG88_12235, partial [Phycisphaerales bacterium]|nr:hypothetical protein [Phycisphaerales bacterium]
DDPSAPAGPIQATPRDARESDGDGAGDGGSNENEEGGVAGGPGQPVIDVMIVYTTIARIAAGGTNAMIATAQDAIDFSNECYPNSGINVRLRMVYCGEVSYNESGTFVDHINRMNNSSDGILDEIHTLRDQYSADVVSLWVDDCDPDQNGNCTLCGRATCNVGAGNPFPIVRWACASGNLSFAHELGHNQGCGHERTTGEGACGPDSAHGWFFTGNDGNNYRTVMATVFAPGSRIRYFSNPNVSFRGMPTGNSSNNNAAQTANRVGDFEGFRTTHYDLWVNFWDDGGSGTQFDPYNSLGQAHANLVTGFNASENPTIWCYSSVGTERLHLNKRCSIRSCGGTIRIIGN